VLIIILWTCCSHHHESRTKKRLSAIKKRLVSLETLVEQQFQQQNDNMQRIFELLQQQRTDVTNDEKPAPRTVTFDAQTDESHT